jgi:hypothetical protein
MKEFVIEGQKSYWGDKCSDKFRKPSLTGRKPVIEDLFAYREQLLECRRRSPAAAAPPARVGLPRAMSHARPAAVLAALLRGAGHRDRAFAVTDPRISAAGHRDGGGAAVLSRAGGPRPRAGAGGSGRGLRPGSQHGGCRRRRRILPFALLPVEPDAAVGAALRAGAGTAPAQVPDPHAAFPARARRR